MSAKRQAEFQLGPDNWDQEDPKKKEDGGSGFQKASKEDLDKRVIRTAKRRTFATGDAPLKPIFGGFNKTQKPSFDFLANLTNGSKCNNISSTLKSDTTAVSTSSVVTSSANSPSTGIFSLSGTSTAKSVIAEPPTQSTIFSTKVSNTGFTQPVFNTTKPDSAVNDNPFKGLASENSLTFLAVKSTTASEKPASQESSTLFKVPANVINRKSPFSSENTSPFLSVQSSTSPEKPASQVPSTLFKTPANVNNNQSPFSSENTSPFLSVQSSTSPEKPVSQVPSTLFKTPANVNNNQSPFSSENSSPFLSVNSSTAPEKPASQVTSTLFKIPANVNNNKSPFCTHNATLIKTSDTCPHSTEVRSVIKTDDKQERELVYYNNLKGLNVSVSAWIKKHVEETPLCILTPIFKDYEKHLKDIQDEFEKRKQESLSKNNILDTKNTNNEDSAASVKTLGSTLFSKSLVSTNFANSSTTEKHSNLTLGTQTCATSSTGFSFGIKSSSNSSSPFGTSTATVNSCIAQTSTATNNFASAVTSATGFKFGIKSSSNSTSPFGANTATVNSYITQSSTTTNNFATTATSSTTGFSFGIKSSSNSNSRIGNNTATVNSCITRTSTTANNFSTVPPLSTGFSFGIKSPSNSTSPFGRNTATDNGCPTPIATTANNFAATPSKGFSFGIKSSSTPLATSTTSSADNGSAASTPFSFGIGKPFSFNANIKKSDDSIKEVEAIEDEPPKVEYTPITEENSVYEKKCKIFVKKESNYIDKGIGTLYIKKIEDTGKHQLLVRANTSLGNVLINLILSSSLPTQRMGKNNVMMICIPTPDAKPPPISFLIRVKTSEDADELLETLNKYKA